MQRLLLSSLRERPPHERKSAKGQIYMELLTCYPDSKKSIDFPKLFGRTGGGETRGSVWREGGFVFLRLKPPDQRWEGILEWKTPEIRLDRFGTATIVCSSAVFLHEEPQILIPGE